MFDVPSVAAHDDGPSVAPANDGSSAVAGKSEVNSDVDDGVEDGEIGVMSPECQDPLLAKTYLGLPILP